MSFIEPRWELVVAFAVANLLTLISVLVFALFTVRKTKAPWRYWFYGAAVFVIFQGVLRLPWMITLGILLSNILTSSTAALIVFSVFAALTAALFERGGQWILFRRFVKPEQRTIKNALMIGAGHGGVEAILIGLWLAAQSIGYLAIFSIPPEELKGYEQPVAQAKALFAQIAWWMPFTGVWERISAQVFQISATVMVCNSFRFGMRWFWLAMGAHFGADFVSPLFFHYAQRWWGVNVSSLVTEVVITIYAAIWAYVAWQSTKNPKRELHTESEGVGNEVVSLDH